MAQLKDLIVSGPTRLLNDLYVQNSIQVTTGIKIGSANELKSFGTGLSINSSGVLSCTVTGTITGSGTNGYLTKWSGGSSITNGPQLGSDATKFLNNAGNWAVPTGTTYSASTGLTLSGTAFSLNTASTSALGGIKVGEGLAINSGNGLLSIDSTGADEGEYLRRGPDGFEWGVPANTTYSAGTGLTLSGTQFSVTSANVSTMMNLLSEGSSNATRNDYIIAQYAGGGTWTTTYHRRKLSNIFAALNSSDITTALGYTPYNSTNPNGYTSNTGTVTSVKLIQGTGITVTSSGTAITTSGERTISLNTASTSALGGVKVGEGLSIVAGSGVLSIDSTGADDGDYFVRGTDGFEWHALPIKLKAYSGSLSGNGWATLQGRSSSGGVLTVAYNNSAAAWNSGTYSASLVFGSNDTKGLVDMAYNTPIVTFGGASTGGSTDAAPTWYMKVTGTNGATYNLASFITSHQTLYEENFQWGPSTVSKSGSVSPIGMALSSEHSANRVAFINGNALSFEYSSDGGSSYTNYNYDASTKSQWCTTSYGVPVGRASGSTNYSTSSRTRVTLTAQNGTTGYVYTNPRKLLINISSSGGMQVLIEYRTGANYQSSGSWSTFGTYSLSGWSGWNDIPLILGTLGGSTGQTGNIWQLRLTFIMTSFNSSYPTTASVNSIRIFGENGWQTTSNLGSTGHLYSYNMSQDATFPRYVYASYFNASNGAENINNSSYSSTATVAFFSSDNFLRKTSKANFATWLGAGSVTSVTLTQGTGITVSDSGTAITTSGTRTISLNTASTSALGGVRVGEGLSITAAGVLAIDSTGADEGEYLRRGPDGFEWGTPVTGSGTNNYLVKWSGTNTVTNGATYDTAASNSTIAQRTANGYLYATYFNNSNAAVNIASYTVRGVNFTSSDGFIRNTSKANFTSWLGLGELAYLSAASGNEGKYLSYDGSSEYSWSGVNSLTGWSALSSTTAVNDFMTGNTLKFAEVKSYTTAALDGNDGVLLSVGYPGTTNGYGMQILMDDNNAKTTIYARGRKATNYDTWRKIAHSGNLTLSISSNNLSLKVDGTTVSTVTLPNTCLAEGTKILMANRTEKNVEDVVAGDAILSYDPNTNQLIEAIVVGNYETGVSDDFVNYYFDDGSFVTIFGKHCLYSATEGTARGVDFWEPGWEGINDKGETITYIGSEDVHNAGRKRHFDLHSSNKLYYANGILNAQSLTLDYPQYKSSDLPQSFITALKQDFDSSANLNTFKFDRRAGAKLVPLLKEMKQQRKLMDDNKKLLADTDYIVAKFTEGLINTVEWLKAKSDRAGWRSLVNKAEEAYAVAKARYDAYKQQYAPTNTKRERFNAAVARDNACLDALKAYYRSKTELLK